MMEPAEAEGGTLRANLRLGAVTLARLQLSVALALGCERVVCLADALDDHILALRSTAEAVGATFHLIAEPRALVGLVTAIDELVALGDGLLAWPRTAMALLEAGPVVLIQPVDAGIVAGFERLDLNHAGAGAFRIPGRLVERLAELPVDCDAFSALQRIALQAGVQQRMVPAAALEDGQWILARSEAEAYAAEAQWMRLQTAVNGGDNASLMAAQLAVRRFGPALLHAGSGNGVVVAAAAVAALLALVAGRFHWVVPAFIVAAIAWLLLCAGRLLARVEREALHLASPPILPGVGSGWMMDAILAVLMLQNIAELPGQNVAERGFAPVVLLGLCRLVSQSLAKNWSRWLEDRGLLALALAVFAAAGVLDIGIETTAVLLLGAGIYCTRSRRTGPDAG
jgi:uncharacterized membrane protein YidH (DUF202 family)